MPSDFTRRYALMLSLDDLAKLRLLMDDLTPEQAELVDDDFVDPSYRGQGVWQAQMLDRTEVKPCHPDLYIFPDADDARLAVGAALEAAKAYIARKQ